MPSEIVVLTLEYKEYYVGLEHFSLIVICVAESKRTTGI